MKISIFLGMSLDGFIAGEGGNLDFLDLYSDPGEDYGYTNFMDTVDCLVMGRNTFEVVTTFPDWPYQKKVFVLTSKQNVVRDKYLQWAEPISGSPKEIVNKLESLGYKHIYLDGGITISHFLSENLVTNMTLSLLPHIQSKGIPLFHSGIGEKRLKLQTSKVFPSGIVQNIYLISSKDV